MWETIEFKSIEHPHTVRMTFELPYLDWCRFENSELFHQLTAYLEGLEKQNIPTSHQEVQDKAEEHQI